MTEENYTYRTSQLLLRSQFPGTGKWNIPLIPKFQKRADDFDELLLIGFDKTHLEDQTHLDRMVHFFLYDYRFERVWKSPDHDIEKLSRYGRSRSAAGCDYTGHGTGSDYLSPSPLSAAAPSACRSPAESLLFRIINNLQFTFHPL